MEELTHNFMPVSRSNTLSKGITAFQRGTTQLNNMSMGGFSQFNDKANLSMSSISNITNTQILTPSKVMTVSQTYRPAAQQVGGGMLGPQHSLRSSSPSGGLPPTSSKKIKLTKLVGKLNKSLEDFFLNDCTPAEDSSYVDDLSMMQHYNMLGGN